MGECVCPYCGQKTECHFIPERYPHPSAHACRCEECKTTWTSCPSLSKFEIKRVDS